MIVVVDTNVVVSAAFWPKRSRDVKDDPFLACALASRAEFIVTKDKDLLALEKPFGVEIVTPATMTMKATIRAASGAGILSPPGGRVARKSR